MAGQIIRRGERKWVVRIYQGRGAGGKRIYSNHTINGTKDDAQTFLNGALRARDLGEFDVKAARKIRMGELFDLVEQDYLANGKDYKWVEQVIRLRLRPYFGDMLAARVDSDTIKRYIAERQKQDEPNATINRALAVLRRAFNLGRKSTPPKVRNVPQITALKENNVRKGFFEDAEFLALREALPEYLRPLVTMAYYTGCRRGELLSLKWSQVDLVRRVVRLNPGETKNDEPRVIPLVPELVEVLKLERARRDVHYPGAALVFTEGGEPIKSIQRPWKAACKAAGLADAKGNPTRLFHDFRRSGVRNLIRAGVPERVAMAISGHKTRSIFDRYNIVSETDLHEATRKLGAYLEEQKAAARHTTGTPADERHTIGTQNGPERVQ